MSRGATATTGACMHCGNESTSPDYCSRCGAVRQPAESSIPVDAPAAAAISCPSCTAACTPGDAFCEVCGLDFTTGERPPSPPEGAQPAVAGEAASWTAVIEADRAFFDSNQVEVAGGLGFPPDLSSREVPLQDAEVVIGRRSGTRGSVPGIDLADDPAVSRRHAILRLEADGSLHLIDQGSANGTWLNDASTPVEPGRPIALSGGDRIRLGAFTALSMRRNNGGS